MLAYTSEDLFELVERVQKMFLECSNRADALRGREDLAGLTAMSSEVGYMQACGEVIAAVNAQIDAMKARVLQ